MAWIVEYLDKSNKTAKSPAFGDLAAAQRYAKTVKGGFVVESTVAAPPVQVQVCDPPALVDARRAQERAAQLAEHEAEAYLETGSQARLAGASTSEALDLAADAAAWVSRGSEIRQACAGGCGRTVTGGFTMCRTCARA